MRFLSTDEVRSDMDNERYFAEWKIPLRTDGIPVIMRQFVGPSGRVDESWRPRDRVWRRTHKLWDYRAGRGEHELEELTREEAEAYIARLGSLIPPRNT